jgi:beta-lactamase regulating signal transducer with metallopeptidase domain
MTMNDLSICAGRWLLHTAVIGGLLLGVTCLLMRWTKQPAKRQRLGDLGMAAALLVAVLSLVGPSWLVISWTRPAPQPAAEVNNDEPLQIAEVTIEQPVRDVAAPAPKAEALAPVAIEQVRKLPLLVHAEPRVVADVAEPAPAFDWLELTTASMLLVFGSIALFFLLRLLLGYAALTRLLLRSEAPPVEVRGLFDAMAAGTRWVRLLVSRRVLVPLSCGLLWPTVVLPLSLCQPPLPHKLRWIFAHELTHLRRRDAWSALLFALGQVLFFAVPWFWWLRRQVRLCQEYVADAAAAGQDEQATEYAEFLVSLAHGPAVPTGAAGVSGNRSDLFRRVSMLLKDPMRVETRCPRRWSLMVAGALVSLGILAGGLTLRAEAANDDTIVIVIRPDGGGNQAGAKVEKKQKIRIFVAPATEDKSKDDESVLLWRLTDADFFTAKAGAEQMIIELAGPGQEWAYLLKRTDNLQPLYAALERLEKLKKEGKLTQKAIQKAIGKALEQMKAQPANPAFDMPIRIHLPDGKDAYHLLIPRDAAVKDSSAHYFLRAIQATQDKDDQDYRVVIRKAVRWLAEQQGKKPGLQIEWEVVPILSDGQDKKTPKKLDNLEQMKRLLEELERLRALEASQKNLEKTKRSLLNEYELLFAIKEKPAAKPRLGVTVEPLSSAMADQLNLPKDLGMLVTDVIADTPAAKLGIKVNDVLLKIGGAQIPADVDDFQKLIASLKSDTPLGVVVLRKGQKQNLGNVKLASAAAPPTSDTYKLTEIINKAVIQKLEAEEKDIAKMTMTRSGDEYTVRYREGQLTITLTATFKDGKGKVRSIDILRENKQTQYSSFGAVPEQFAPRVRQMFALLEATVNQGDKN